MPPEVEEKEQVVEKKTEFIDYLLKLAKDENRGALAELRSEAPNHPHYGAKALKHVARFFGDSNVHRQDAMLMVATLFALCPSEGDPPDKSIAASLRELSDTKRDEDAGKHDVHQAIERRFLILLDARPEDLGAPLRHAVQLVHDAGIEIGWSRLLKDVEILLGSNERWKKSVLRRWSRDFWSGPRDSEEPEVQSSSDSDAQ